MFTPHVLKARALVVIIAMMFLLPRMGIAADPAAVPPTDYDAAAKRSLEYFDKQYARAKNDQDRSTALVGKARSQTSMGFGQEALATLAQAQALTPDSLAIKLQHAITIDYLGQHEEAYTEFAALLTTIGSVNDQISAIGRRPSIAGINLKKASPIADIAFQVQRPAARNLVFLGRYAEALEAYAEMDRLHIHFENMQETLRKQNDEAEHTYFFADLKLNGVNNDNEQWLLWLTASVNSSNREQVKTLLTKQARKMKCESNYTAILARYYSGELTTESVFKAFDQSAKKADAKSAKGKTDLNEIKKSISDLATGGHTRGAFFCAGYLRFVAGDYAGAVKLLEDEAARPDGDKEIRLFISQQLADKSWQDLANSKPYTPAAGPAALREDTQPWGRFAANVSVPEGLSLAQVHEAVTAALQAKKWRITSDVESKATAEYGRAKGPMAPGVAELTLAYDANAICIYNANSWSPTWVDFLQKELGVQLSRKKALK